VPDAPGGTTLRTPSAFRYAENRRPKYPAECLCADPAFFAAGTATGLGAGDGLEAEERRGSSCWLSYDTRRAASHQRIDDCGIRHYHRLGEVRGVWRLRH
jgi:hypothetical protein